MNLPTFQPNHVYSLRKTSTFESVLSNVTGKVQAIIENEVQRSLDNNLPEEQRVITQELIHSSPFSGIEDPLIFPFLLIEAKSEERGSFHGCCVQSAIPIWYLIRIQEKLHEFKGLHEQGGPFVWYVAYKGDDWRLSGCCTVIEKGHVTYVK